MTAKQAVIAKFPEAHVMRQTELVTQLRAQGLDMDTIVMMVGETIEALERILGCEVEGSYHMIVDSIVRMYGLDFRLMAMNHLDRMMYEEQGGL